MDLRELIVDLDTNPGFVRDDQVSFLRFEWLLGHEALGWLVLAGVLMEREVGDTGV